MSLSVFNSTIYPDDAILDNVIKGENQTEKWYTTTFMFENTTTPRPYWMGVLDKTSAVIMTVNLVTLMLGMGAATYLREVWLNIKRPWGSLIGMSCQFGVLPAIGFGLCLALKLPPYQALSVLILTCSPGGAFSNFFTYWVDGDIALSILMTATSSLLAFGGMPLNIWLYTKYWTDDTLRIPYVNVLISMCFVTGPAIIGMVIRHYTRVWANRISKLCGILGWVGALSSGVLLLIIYWEKVTSVDTKVMIVSACIPIIGFTIAYIIAKMFCLNHKVSRTIGIETGCQNIAVAINVILLSYSDVEIRGQMIMIPSVYGLFQLMEIFIGIIVFHIHKFIHRNDVTEEDVKSKIDNTILTRVPVPMQTDVGKVTQRQPDLLYRDRVIMDRNSIKSMSLQKLSESQPFLELQNNHNEQMLKEQPRALSYHDSSPYEENVQELIYHLSNMGNNNRLIEPQINMDNIYYGFTDKISNGRPVILEDKNKSSKFVDELKPPHQSVIPRSPSLNEGYEFRTFGSSVTKM